MPDNVNDKIKEPTQDGNLGWAVNVHEFRTLIYVFNLAKLRFSTNRKLLAAFFDRGISEEKTALT